MATCLSLQKLGCHSLVLESHKTITIGGLKIESPIPSHGLKLDLRAIGKIPKSYCWFSIPYCWLVFYYHHRHTQRFHIDSYILSCMSSKNVANQSRRCDHISGYKPWFSVFVSFQSSISIPESHEPFQTLPVWWIFP